MYYEFPCIAGISVVVLKALGDNNERKLINNLMDNYDKRLRPSTNGSQPLNVTFGLALAQLIDVVRS